jgi:hypothetical protein
VSISPSGVPLAACAVLRGRSCRRWWVHVPPPPGVCPTHHRHLCCTQHTAIWQVACGPSTSPGSIGCTCPRLACVHSTPSTPCGLLQPPHPHLDAPIPQPPTPTTYVPRPCLVCPRCSGAWTRSWHSASTSPLSTGSSATPSTPRWGGAGRGVHQGATLWVEGGAAEQGCMRSTWTRALCV